LSKKEAVEMIVPSMTRKEIASHLLSEVRNNKKRIETKVFIVAKKMQSAARKVHVYQQRVGSNTLFTIYIYGIDDKGVDFAAGLWYRSEKGMCWVTSGQFENVVFYTDHFFERYAERYLKKTMSTQDAAIEYYREYKVSMALRTEEIAEGVYKTQLPLYVGGLALGFNDRNTNIVVYNTYVSPDLFYGKQINDVEADKELNEALQSMNASEWRLIGEAMKM
jgi:hypothetical protein